MKLKDSVEKLYEKVSALEIASTSTKNQVERFNEEIEKQKNELERLEKLRDEFIIDANSISTDLEISVKEFAEKKQLFAKDVLKDDLIFIELNRLYEISSRLNNNRQIGDLKRLIEFALNARYDFNDKKLLKPTILGILDFVQELSPAGSRVQKNTVDELQEITEDLYVNAFKKKKYKPIALYEKLDIFADDTIFAPSFEGKSSEVRLDREKQEVIVNEINGEFDLDVVEDDDTFSDLEESTLAGDSKNEEE